jgi:hypothetical protein
VTILFRLDRRSVQRECVGDLLRQRGLEIPKLPVKDCGSCNEEVRRVKAVTPCELSKHTSTEHDASSLLSWNSAYFGSKF